MRKAYQEMFDEVRASGRLRQEVMNMTKQERTAPKRRMPRAAIVAAALVLAQAGTALAAEVLGAISIRFLDGGGEDSASYQVLGDLGRVPVEIFSDELLAWAADGIMDISGEFTYNYRRFDYWAEAEAFMGVKLAENTVMEKPGRRGWQRTMNVNGVNSEEDYVSTHCMVDMVMKDGLPYRVSVEAYYRADCGEGKKEKVRVQATMFTEVMDDVTNWCYEEGVLRDSREWDECTCETYITPNGLEATIVSEELEPYTWEYDGNEVTEQYVFRTAYFIWNDVFYEVSGEDIIYDGLEFEEGFEPDPQAALYAIKFILDGFQP